MGRKSGPGLTTFVFSFFLFFLTQCGLKTEGPKPAGLQAGGLSAAISLEPGYSGSMIGSSDRSAGMSYEALPRGSAGGMKLDLPKGAGGSTPHQAGASNAASVTTRHYDNSNSGINPNETTLTTANVNSTDFGLLFQAPVDGQIYAQPLYLPLVYVMGPTGMGFHNVVFVATENDSVYAVDADNGQQLWADHFAVNSSGYAVTPVPCTDLEEIAIVPSVGITGTPVIDPSTDTLYVVTKVKKVNAAGTDIRYVQQLHALDVTAGAEKFGGPVTIADTSYVNGVYTQNAGPSVAGTGSGSVNGMIPFNAMRQNQRANLVLSQNNVLITFASYGDTGPYQGWILSYNAATLALDGVFNAAPNGSDAGFWQSGGGVVVDSTGNIYASSGNGTFDTTLNSAGFPSSGDYGDAVVKLVVDSTTTPSNPGPNGWGLTVTDYFSPYYTAMLSSDDFDLGAGGIFLLPDSAGISGHPHLMVAIGKEGITYILDRDNLGKFFPSSDNVIQEMTFASGLKAWSNSIFFNSNLFFFGTQWGSTTQASAGQVYSYLNGQFSSSSTTIGTDFYSYPGTTPSLSSNQGVSPILWTTEYSSHELRAYDANNPGTELYTSAQAGTRDSIVSVVKFNPPVVVNGKVYVGTYDSIAAYGLLSDQTTGDAKTNPVIRDFNGDGMSDLLFRQPSTGEMVAWLIDTDQYEEQTNLPTETDTTWNVQGNGHFTGNMTSGLLWRNSVSGEIVTWTIANGTFQTQIGLPTVADQTWVIQGTGDFNGDGTQTFWRNSIPVRWWSGSC